MRNHGKTLASILLPFLGIALFALAPDACDAAEYFGGVGVSQYWDYSTPCWSVTSGGQYTGTWVDGGDAIFQGSAGTVTVSGAISSVNSITFGTDGSSC